MTLIESQYIHMFKMYKQYSLWPWQWGFADEPLYEHIRAIEVMDGFFTKAEEFHKPKEKKTKNA